MEFHFQMLYGESLAIFLKIILGAVHILHSNLSIKHIFKVSKTTYFRSVLETLFVPIDSYDSINKKPPLLT